MAAEEKTEEERQEETEEDNDEEEDQAQRQLLQTTPQQQRQQENDVEKVTLPLLLAISVASMSQFLTGYNTGVMNAPVDVVFEDHSIVIWSVAVAAFALGGPFGAVMAGTLADRYGRRRALLFDSCCFLLGGTIQSIAPNMYGIVLARFIIGFASGISTVLVPIYLKEQTPSSIQGTIGTLAQLAVVIGILASDVLAFPFAKPFLWRILFSVTAILAVLQLLCSPLLLESPRWLLNKDAESQEARDIVKKIRGFDSDEDVEAEILVLLQALQREEAQQQQSSAINTSDANAASLGWFAPYKEMFTDRSVRLLVISAVVLQMAQQLCGINAVIYYSTLFFKGVIDNPIVGTTIVGAVNVIATCLVLLLMDSTGRRTLILWSSGGMFFCCIIIVLSLLQILHGNWIALSAVNLYVAFFEIGLGPIPFLIVPEMFGAKYVAVAMSTSFVINWTCNFIIGLVFPFMDEYLGAYSFLPFAVVLLGTFCFAAFLLPETHDTTPEELRERLLVAGENDNGMTSTTNSNARVPQTVLV